MDHFSLLTDMDQSVYFTMNAVYIISISTCFKTSKRLKPAEHVPIELSPRTKKEIRNRSEEETQMWIPKILPIDQTAQEAKGTGHSRTFQINNFTVFVQNIVTVFKCHHKVTDARMSRFCRLLCRSGKLLGLREESGKTSPFANYENHCSRSRTLFGKTE